jgi:hypothetical protein
MDNLRRALKPERSTLRSLPLIVKYLISVIFLFILIAIAYFVQNEISADTATPLSDETISIALNNYTGDDTTAKNLFLSKITDTFTCESYKFKLIGVNKTEIKSKATEDKISLEQEYIRTYRNQIIAAIKNNLLTVSNATVYNCYADYNQAVSICATNPSEECVNKLKKAIVGEGLKPSCIGAQNISYNPKVLSDLTKVLISSGASGGTQPGAGTSTTTTTGASTTTTSEITEADTQEASSSQDSKITIKKISVYLKKGDKEVPVKYATIIGTYTDSSDKKATLSELNSINTGDKNYLENVRFEKPSDAKNDSVLNIVAKKRNKSSDEMISSDDKTVRFINKDDIKLVFTQGADIDPDKEDTSTAQPPTDQILPTTSNNFPNGNNTVKFAVVRKSEAANNGWTPVGAVNFKLNISTNEKPQKTSFIPKVLAADNSNLSNIAKTAQGATPYDSNIVKPYTQDAFEKLKNMFSDLIKDIFKGYDNYSFSGTIADSGTQSMINLQKLPAGVYTLEISKNHFKTMKYLFTISDSTQSKLYDLGGLPISPQKGAEPPSIAATDVIKTTNSDYYKAILSNQGYLYNENYPWKGWQKMSSDSSDNYGFDTNIPTDTDAAGMPEFNDSSNTNVAWGGNIPATQASIDQFIQCVSSQAQSQFGFTAKVGNILAGAGIIRIINPDTGAITINKIIKEAFRTVGVSLLADALFGTNTWNEEVTVSLGPIYDNCARNINTATLDIPVMCKPCIQSPCKEAILSGRILSECSQCSQCLQNYPVLKSALKAMSN